MDGPYWKGIVCAQDLTISLQRLDIRGKIKQLHGQNRKTEEPPLALFCICTPFGPPSLLEMPQKEVNSSFFSHQVTFAPKFLKLKILTFCPQVMFKSKHKLDLGIVSFDQRGKEVLGFSETEFAALGIYDIVHPEDLAYVASAHQECKSSSKPPLARKC